MFGNAKKRNIGSDPHKVEDLVFEVEIKLRTKEDYSQSFIANLKIEKNLIVNSDSRIKLVREEIDTVLGGIYQDLSDRIEVHPLLTDGYWEEKNKKIIN